MQLSPSMFVGTAVMIALVVAELPPPMVSAEESYTPPPIVEVSEPASAARVEVAEPTSAVVVDGAVTRPPMIAADSAVAPPLVEAPLANPPTADAMVPPPLVEAPLLKSLSADAMVAPPLVEAPVVNARAIPEVQASGNEVRAAPRRPFVGLAFDAALPDGAGVNLMVRPFHWLELHAGVAHNAITPGFRGGVTFLPLDRWFVPTLTLELGTHPPGDANPLLRAVTGNNSLRIGALENIGYDFQNALLGFTFGSREHFTIFLRGGITRVVGRTGSDNTVISSGGGSGTGVGTVTVENPTLLLPAAKVGFALYFF